MVVTQNEESAEQRERKEPSCNIIIHAREENKEQSDDALFVNSMMQQVCVTRRSVVVINTGQLHSTKPELRFCAGSNPARGVSEICDGGDL